MTNAGDKPAATTAATRAATRAERIARAASYPRGDKRELILEAATRVFALSGYHGTRVADVADEAGIAYGLVYHYFKNKDELLFTMFEERWSIFERAIAEIGAGPGDVREKLLSIATLALDGYRQRPDWVKVLVFEFRRSSRFVQPSQEAALRSFYDAFGELLRAAQERGELQRGFDAQLAATVFIGALELLLTNLALGALKLVEGDDAQRAQLLSLAEQLVEMFLHGIDGARRAGDAAR